ncbi:helix-turn-helix domain-containing protein [Cryomorpha ignava]|uniref:Helix-turn-helix domain-containing protein n=1 Tax=Cryomorpha ignava TaxID=101383 RepID=A0A7K3WSQ5_9FLAO|nr:excisionase family DNA-binding protein [Cryomorpha ignava]NEN23685.1 helix-turn-helix domain-containing protein [Cryomorpha ignava]
MEAITEQTTKADQKIALNSLDALLNVSNRVKASRKTGVKIKVQETGEFMTIPKKALELLFSIVQNMSEGRSISLVPSDLEVSTQQAADMLNVSRPYLVKLIESGNIPFKKIGSHRRILLQDIIAYQSKLACEREKQLDFLANQAQELNLGYE